MKGKHSPRFSVNRVLRRIFGHKSDEITRSGEHCIMRRFMICTAHKTLFGLSAQFKWHGQSMWHVCGTEEVHTEFWWGNLREGDYLEDLGLCGIIILKRIVRKSVGRAWIGLIWLRTGVSEGCCKCGKKNCEFYKMW
jgi:hypothetical protein